MSRMKTQNNLHSKLDSSYKSSGLKTNFMKNLNRLYATTKAGHQKYSRKGSAQTQKSGQLSKDTLLQSISSPTSMKRAITQSYIEISQKSGIFSEVGSPLRKKQSKLRKSMKVSTLEIDELPNNQSNFQPVIEFISYCLSKSEETGDSSQLLKAKYALQLRNIEQKVQKAQQQLINLRNSRPNINQAIANIQEQELKTEQLTEQTNMEILKMVSSRADYRDLKRHIKATIAELQQKQQQYYKYFEVEQKCQLDKIGEQMKIKNSLTETINQLQYEMSTIKKFRESIKDKKQRVRVTAKTQKSFYVLYDQLIKQKSSKDLKSQLEGSQKLLDSFYKSMDKKVQIIKNAVVTHNETHQFLASLDIHNESLSVKLTKEAYELNQTEKKELDHMKTQMNVYRQFLKGEGEFKKISGALQNIEQKCEENLKKMKQEIDEMQMMKTEQQKRLSELQSIQIIRQAEIHQLNAILKQKKSEILRSKVRSDQTDSFDIFRNSIANFGKKKSNVSNC